MLLRLLLELLALVGNSAEEVQAIANEVHSSDPTGTKVAKIATAAGTIAAGAAAVIPQSTAKE